MERINFVNDNEPYLSAETLNKLQDNIENALKKNSITVGLSANQEATSVADYEPVTVLLDKIMSQTGTDLGFINNAVKLPTNCKKIKVSANALAFGTDIGFGIYIFVGGVTKIQGFKANIQGTSFETLSLAPFDINVNGGELVTMGLYLGTAGHSKTLRADSGRSTYMTVEVLE